MVAASVRNSKDRLAVVGSAERTPVTVHDVATRWARRAVWAVVGKMMTERESCGRLS